MSWSWRGFFRDDPVFRFKQEGFFQSGRHAAEERFWKLKIHEDGSYVRRNASSLDNFYTMKDALSPGGETVPVEEELKERTEAEERKRREEELKRREGSVEEKSQLSSESESSSSEDDEELSPEEIARRRKQLEKLLKKNEKAELKGKEAAVKTESAEMSRQVARVRELEREREMERRERELELRERELERQSRSREQTPEYNAHNPYSYRSRRNSEISNKDYPYSVCSDYTPATAPIKEEEEKGRKGAGRSGYYPYNENISTRYF